MSRQRGFALLIVLWSVALLGLVGAQLTSSARTEARIAANLRANAVAEAAADGGVQEAVFRLIGAPGVAPRLAFETRIGEAPVTVRAEPVAGLVNPNAAPPGLLAALMQQAGIAPRDANALGLAIVAWHEAQRRPFARLDELSDVPGMTPPVLAAIRPFLSVHNRGAVDPALAPPPVARALMLSGLQQEEGDDIGTVATIAAEARAEGGAFTRRAVVRLLPSRPERPFQVLAWESGS